MTRPVPVKVVVFDLNKTFYRKSSKEEFYKFICTKRPKRLRYFFEMLWFTFLEKLNLIRQTEFKENFFNYLDNLPPEKVKQYAEEFWQKEYPHNFNSEIKQRLEEAKANSEELFCATGALEVYVEPLFKLFPVAGFAGTKAQYNGSTYKVVGKACKGEEKVKRLEEHYRGRKFTLTEAYSDKPEELFEFTQKPFLVKKGKINPIRDGH
ncbi:HAD family hydrolase [Adhaeribacter soli]|uniref:Haloacid dehalogenase-like hydrolase n=1 Tax=Adhaeribacter soli TaxID=2607655 RepID=A0A5N1IRU2_9BACT|nr:HAD family hydrolase [Adhaeribacter soli]KAA9332730.1 haloacid dehalogenase-like hydrolase [Adhaeribacter soli]